MNHKNCPRRLPAHPVPSCRQPVRKALGFALPALLALTGLGCFRASGLQRSTTVAEAVPEFNGDRVAGLKAMAGPGDYYLGNDFLQIAVDGTVFGDTSQPTIAGAASGGSIVDAGYISLDTSYHRINMPGDALERLTPVANQDPGLEVVVDAFRPDNSQEPSSLTMTGRILDRGHRIPGATWDGADCVAGVTVTHVLSVGKLDRYITMSTTVTNRGGAPVGIRSVGDFLSQTTGGYRFAVPAGISIGGQPLATPWGIQIPGSDWGSPIATAVQAPSVVFFGTEPSGNTVDSHTTLGILPTDTPACMVTSDPQDALTGLRPVFPSKLVVGNLPLPPAGLAPGASLTFNRRLYAVGGTSSSALFPSMTAGIYNQMAVDMYDQANNPNQPNSATITDGLWPQDFGRLTYTMSGSAVRQGPLPTEIRVDRLAGGTDADPLWIPIRVDWLEPGENPTSQSATQSSSVADILPVGTYRLVITNQLGTQVKDSSIDANNVLRALLSGPIDMYAGWTYAIGGYDYLMPEVNQVVDGNPPTVIRSIYGVHYFTSRGQDAPVGSPQPLRIVIKGTGGTPDPWMRRSRTLGSYYDLLTQHVQISPVRTPGQNQFRAGNEMFGTGFASFGQTTYFWVPNGFPNGQVNPDGSAQINGGTYRAYGTRGPLSQLEYLDILAYEGQGSTAHQFIIWPSDLPSGWTSFDLPGPSQATGGGYLPGEKLTSAMAEGVHVVGHTELDLGTDAQQLYNDFTWEFNAANFLATYLVSIGNDPFVVGGRTSVLPGYGTATALFTPAATPYRFGGALQPQDWTLADFMAQAQGQYTIIHQPRSSQGLFTQAGFDPATPVGQGANAWWTAGGLHANGQTNGGFDAIELLRGEGFDAADPDPWFAQFKQVRSDWFALLNQQTPTRFTKALGLSSAKFSIDTPVGLARTYLKAQPVLTIPPIAQQIPDINTPLVQDLSTVQSALQSGAAVASTGPFLDVSVAGVGPGGLVPGPMAQATVTVNLYASSWMQVDEVRIVMNGAVVATVPANTLAQSATDVRLRTGSFKVALPTGGSGAWIVVEAGVPLAQTGPFAQGTPWSYIMRGIYPIAVANPIFIDVTGHGYTHP